MMSLGRWPMERERDEKRGDIKEEREKQREEKKENNRNLTKRRFQHTQTFRLILLPWQHSPLPLLCSPLPRFLTVAMVMAEQKKKKRRDASDSEWARAAHDSLCVCVSVIKSEDVPVGQDSAAPVPVSLWL